MIKRLYRLILVLLILSLALYIVLLNRESVTLNLGNGQTFITPLGAMVVFMFSFGVLCTALIASLYGFRAYLRERGFLGLERKRLELASDSAKARGLTLSGQYATARRLWETLVKREPSEIQSRLWLARTLEEEGNSLEALKIIDSARSLFSGDCEVLFRAAELNKKLGNKTAAVDNLALIIALHPSEKATREARDLSVELGRLADALEYNKQLEQIGANRKELRDFEAKTRFTQLQLNPDFSSSSLETNPEYYNALKDLVRDFPESSAALIAIAEIEKKEGDFEAASQALVKAAISEQSPSAWQLAIDLWISQKQPERAISVARLAIKESAQSQIPEYELMLANLYIQFGMYSDARLLLESLSKNIKNVALQHKITPLLGRCLLASGQEREAAELWRKIS